MRPPTELERLAVFLAAMAAMRLLLERTQPTQKRPSGELVKIRAARVFINGQDVTNDPRYVITDPYRARYGADNPGAN